MPSPIGVLGMGVHSPPHIRTNDAWSSEVVAQWPTPVPEHRDAVWDQRPTGLAGTDIASALIAQTAAPFTGISERRVLQHPLQASEMEWEAASEALRAAAVTPADLHLVLCASVVPDQLIGNNACRLHARLGARPRCAAVSIDAACNGFLLSLALAVPFLEREGGCALLVQSSAISRLLDYTRPSSQYFGDAAVAAVIGPVSSGRGLLATIAHVTDGSLVGAAAAGPRGRPWYAGGQSRLHCPDPPAARRMMVESLDIIKTAADAVLAESGVAPGEIDFFNTHQGFPWMLDATRQFLGLTSAGSLDTFSRYGNCAAATLPMGVALAAECGALRAGDMVLLAGLGVGSTAAAALLRWGR
jgi:3-oxoacyl-[acyl-carrier-protein] synthase III